MPIVRSNGVDIAYDEIGDSRAPALLMLMGLGCQRTLWALAFCQAIAERGLRVVRVDNRDVGESSRFDHLGRPSVPRLLLATRLGLPYRPPYTLADMARDTLGLVDALGLGGAHVLGGSMGGMIAQQMALIAPERVRSLCLWMTTMGDRPLPPPRPSVALPLLRPTPRDREGLVEHRMARLKAISCGNYPFDEAMARAMVEASAHLEDDRGGFERQMAASLSSPSRKEALASLDCPTLVLHGTRDPLIPLAHGEAIARTVPGARLERLEGAGHEYPRPLWPRLVDLIAGHALSAEGRRVSAAAE